MEIKHGLLFFLTSFQYFIKVHPAFCKFISILGQIILYCGGCPLIFRILMLSLVSTHWMPVSACPHPVVTTRNVLRYCHCPLRVMGKHLHLRNMFYPVQLNYKKNVVWIGKSIIKYALSVGATCVYVANPN